MFRKKFTLTFNAQFRNVLLIYLKKSRDIP